MMTVVRSEVGPTAPLAEMHREHYRSLVKLAALLVDDRATCEEVVQDAFVAVFRSAARLRAVEPLVSDVASAETEALLADGKRAVIEAMRTLPDRQRDVLVLRFYLDLSESEIANTLGIGAGTVKTHARRGLDALARKLESQR